MRLDELRHDLSARMGRRVIELFTRDGEPVQTMRDLYQPSPAGFGGKLCVAGGGRFAWELWLEDGDRWNFHVQRWPIEPSAAAGLQGVFI